MPTIANAQLHKWLSEVARLPSTADSEHLYRPSAGVSGIRHANLARYMDWMYNLRPTVLLVGEAPGYRGSRRTGVPFMSEQVLLNGLPGVRLPTDGLGFQLAIPGDRVHKEATSAIMWQTIGPMPVPPLLWAAFPHHPHRPGEPHSNRSPNRLELTIGQGALAKLIDLFSISKVVAVGNVAKATLDMMGFAADKIRHPAHGGAQLFVQQLGAVFNQLPPPAPTIADRP